MIGAAERCLELMCKRALTRTAFGRKLAQHGTVLADIADSRIELDQVCFLVIVVGEVKHNETVEMYVT